MQERQPDDSDYAVIESYPSYSSVGSISRRSEGDANVPLLDNPFDDSDPIEHGNDVSDESSEDEVVAGETVDWTTPVDLRIYEDVDANNFVLDFIHETHIGPYRRQVAKRMWDLFRRHNPQLGFYLQSYDTLERRLQTILPQPVVEWKVQNRDTRKFFSGSGNKFPDKVYGNRDTYEILQVWTRLRVRDVVRLHGGSHEDQCEFVVDRRILYDRVHITITCDGIPNGRGSSQDNLHLISLRFRGCKLVYVVQARVAKRHEPKDAMDFFGSLVKECNDLGVTVDYFIADAPMRAFAKRMKGHAGRYSCETCEARGVCVNRKIVYPGCMVMQRRRTKERWLENVVDLEQQQVGGFTTQVKGVMGRSPLLDLHSFNIIDQAPTDPLHRDWLGLVKGTLWRHTIGMGKGHVSARGQRVTNVVSDHYRTVRLPEEFSHRSRAIDYANFKAHEWKSMVMTSFDTLCEVVNRECGEKLCHIWIRFVFLVLVYYGPEWLFHEFEQDYLHDIHEGLYDDFEMEFGQGACSYNWHSFYHMPIVRRLGRMCHVSTEPFESAYGSAQGSYQSGTRNIGLQIVRNMLMRCSGHLPQYCKYKLLLEPEKPSLRSDNSIALDRMLNYFKVIAVNGIDVTVKKMMTREWDCPHDSTLPFRSVGVVMFTGQLDDEVLTYPREYFMGKGVLLSSNLLIPFYWDLLYS